MSSRVEWLQIVGDVKAWRSIGLTIDESGLVPLMGTSLRIVETQASSTPGNLASDERNVTGIAGWGLSGVDAGLDATFLDGGLRTSVVEPSGPTLALHDLGVTGLDHLVVLTCDLERTTGAIAAATGCECKRIREVGAMRQGFHRIGPGGLVVEVVERPEVPDGPPRFWGLVLNVEDLDAACDHIGTHRISAPKDAVQHGRRIATVKSDVGLGLAVALMTPS